MLAAKPERKIPLGRPRRRWEDNIRTYVREIGWQGVEWMLAIQVGTSLGSL
jgi:hypothetical protein